jgi:hypothetical protein
MSDPNMRRWLALSNQIALQDLNAMTGLKEMTPHHIWLTREPTAPGLKILHDEALLHLGVMPGWMKHWSDASVGNRPIVASHSCSPSDRKRDCSHSSSQPI